jgi:hypothetical protein
MVELLDKYVDVAMQYICLQAINKLSICDAGDTTGEWFAARFAWQIFAWGISCRRQTADDGALLA